MKTILRIEIFNDDLRNVINMYKIGFNNKEFSDTFASAVPNKSWVAEISGMDSKYKYSRNFLKFKKDYSQSNSKGSRGIYAEYILEAGHIYDVKSQVSNRKCERFFCIVSESGEIKKISEEEVIEWLKSRSE